MPEAEVYRVSNQGSIKSNISNATLVLDARNIVGESIVWDHTRNTLFWVDILGRRIHSWSPSSGKHQCWDTPEIVTSIGLRHDDGAIVGLRKRLSLWNFDQQFIDLATIEPDQPSNRLNEGVVGPDNDYWVGTMQNNINDDDSPRDVTASTGHVYKASPDGTILKLSDDTFGITNTLAWRADGTMIVGDTLQNTLYTYRLKGLPTTLTERNVYQQGFKRGLPDGSCLDAEGYLWNCRVVGGSCVARFDPDGQIERIVELPCSWPTSCCFGGPNLDELYVTSARFTMSDEHLANHPHEGALFRIRPGVVGLQPFRFGASSPMNN